MVTLEVAQHTHLENTEIVFNIIQAGLTGIAIIIGGWWALYRFRIFRENKALIDFSVDIVFHKKINGWWVVELVAFIENKGKVKHQIEEFDFDLYSLTGQDKIETSDEFGGQVKFPNQLAKGSFLPKKYKYFFIEPGLKNKYSYITRVSEKAELIIMHSWFKYLDGKHSHTAEKTIKVPLD